MIVIRNVHTGYEFDLDDNAGAELLRANKFDFEIVKATKEALKEVEEVGTPTDEQRLLGEKTETEIEDKYKDVELIEDEEVQPKKKKRGGK